MLRSNDRPAAEVLHIGAFKLFPSQRRLMRDAEVVKLYHLKSLNYRQIAKQLGIAENSVGPILSRARQQLRRTAQQRTAT